jgi:hypothetical protein
LDQAPADAGFCLWILPRSPRRSCGRQNISGRPQLILARERLRARRSAGEISLDRFRFDWFGRFSTLSSEKEIAVGCGRERHDLSDGSHASSG